MGIDTRRRAAAWAACHLFAVMCSYYVLRAVRDEAGAASGVERLPWLFTATFVASIAAAALFGLAASRVGRVALLSGTYGFFASNLAVFLVLFQTEAGRRAGMPVFFVWLSVFNLSVVSVFWSFMADRFTAVEGRELFGLLAAGGGAGAIVGPALAAALAPHLGPTGLLPISGALLVVAIVAVGRVAALAPDAGREPAAPVGGAALDGVRLLLRSPLLAGVGLFVACYTTLSTFLYFQQAAVVAARFADPGERTAFFASVDLAVNASAVLLQLFATARVVRWAGLAVTLAAVPLAVACGLVALAAAPSLATLVAVQVVHRAGNFGLLRPGREMLFTVVGRPDRYKTKSVLDTVVYRGGDATSAWLVALVHSSGLGLTGSAAASAVVALAWALTGFLVGRFYERGQQEAG